MEITVLVENDIADQHADLVAEWGLSVHIKHRAKQIAYAALKSVPGDKLAEIHTGTTMTV